MVGNALKNVIVIGDKVLIKPRTLEKNTQSDLYLLSGLQEKEKIQFGYILKLGSGHPLPPEFSLEPWEELTEQNDFIPLQVKEGVWLFLYTAKPIRFCLKQKSTLLSHKMTF